MKLFAALFLWGLAVACPAMALWPNAEERALALAAGLFRAGDLSSAAATLEPWTGRSVAAGREALALHFLAQDLSGTAALAPGVKPQALDDEARLWVARAEIGLARWGQALVWLDSLERQGPMAKALRAETLQALGSTQSAQASVEALSATAGTRLFAATALLAAEAAAAAGDPALAEQRYKAAEKADGSYTMVHARLAALYRSAGRMDDARVRLERARKVDPGDEGLRQALNLLMEEQPEQAEQQRQEQNAKTERFIARSAPQVSPTAQLDGEPLVRVGLLEKAPRFDLVLGGAYALEGPLLDGPQGLTLAAGSVWRVRLAPDGGWQLQALTPAAQTLRFSQVLRLKPLEEGATFGLHGVAHGSGYFWARDEDRYYRGVIELRPQGAEGMTLVDELGLESYLLSVVPSEILPHWKPEALKAQAIAARTEAWRTLGRFKAKGYDLCPTVLCAVYAGVGAEDPRTTAAVRATAGLVLQGPRGHLAPTFYMHNSGGHTQEPGEAWGGASTAPPMATVDAPWGQGAEKLFPVSAASLLHFIDDLDGTVAAWPKDSSTFRWTLRLSAAELAESVGRRHHQVLPLRRLVAIERSAGGYVRRMLFEGAQGSSIGSSDYIRTALRGAKSNLFYIEPRFDAEGRPQSWLIHGGGWGHGVGMSQAGARAMAEAGKDAGEILEHYFHGTTMARRYGPHEP